MASKKVRDVASEMKDVTRKIWLAGLGALAAAEEEGTRAFKTLVKHGSAFESRNRPKVHRSVKSAKGKVKNAWDKVGSSFDAQVASVLIRLGVPTRDEMSEMNRRLDRLEKAQGRKKAAVRKRKAAKKPATKKTPAARRKA
jgi:poly(hydroxyalkanoate) granule-associated protein